MVANPLIDSTLPSGSFSGGDTVIAQYLATKESWWVTYPRILVVTASTLSTYNPETFLCTNQWNIIDIEAVKLFPTKNDFVLRLETSRFRSARLKFNCPARGHLLSLLAKLRCQAKGKASLYRLVYAPRIHFRCIEQYANGSNKLLFLQVTVSSIVFLDERGRHVQNLPYLYLRMTAYSTEHCEGMVLSTAFHDRFFICTERHDCLNEIVAAANEVGIGLCTTSTHITAQQLRFHNLKLLNRASVIRFDVKMANTTVDEGDAVPRSDSSDTEKKVYKKIQLILQGDFIVEMHCSMRTVIARPYSALLAIVRPDWDLRMLVLEFKQEELLILDVDGRDQLVIMLLLVCREAGQHNVVLNSSRFNYCRFYYPHTADSATDDSNTAGVTMTTFLLRRLSHTGRGEDSYGEKGRSSSVWSFRRRQGGLRASLGNNDTARSDTSQRGGWFQRRINSNKRATEPSFDMRHSIDSGLFMYEGVSITVAMEELNANLPLDELMHSGPGQADEVNKSIRLVFEHFIMLVATHRRYGDTTRSEITTTIQALLRLYHHPDACFTDEMIPQLFDTVHELVLQQEVLTCYWCLRLLQCLLGIRTINTAPGCNGAGDQRAKLIQHLVYHEALLHTIAELIPASLDDLNNSSGVANLSFNGTAFWVDDPEIEFDLLSNSSTHPSILFTKEAQIQNTINVVFYETLLTLHQIVVYLQSAVMEQRATLDCPNYVAASNRHSLQKNNLNDTLAVKQIEAVAEKLLEKHRFLVESIIDVRLVRMAETSVALVKFVLFHFATRATHQPHVSPLSHFIKRDFNDTQKERLRALNSFLNSYQAITESSLEPPSLLFCTGKTIEMPVYAFSNSTSDCTNAAADRLLYQKKLNDVASNGSMRLEYLNSMKSPSSIRDDKKNTPIKPEPYKSPSEEMLQKLLTQKKKKKCILSLNGESTCRSHVKQQAKYDLNHAFGPQICKKQNQLSVPAPAKRLSGQISPISIACKETSFLSEMDTENTIRPLLESRYSFPGTCSSQAFQASFKASGSRTSNECDACIGCNDVCTNEICFSCAEKKYHVCVAFANSLVTSRATGHQSISNYRMSSSNEHSCNVEREYSSCEMKRHQNQRSCWIRIGDSIADVTSLLVVHPGGAHVILEAAKHGKDCGRILELHPPAALEKVMQYRLGRYYCCSSS